jgi:uroporphyrinogen decarboxylase
MRWPRSAARWATRVPLIGFTGSPWTLASYMVEGGSGSATDYRTIKTMLYDRPDLLHRILDVTATAVTDYLNAQIESGAQAVMIFDSWGGVLSHAAYREFSLGYMQRIIAGLKRERDGQRVPCIVFTKGGGQWLEAIADIGCDAVGLDWTTDLGEARRRVGSRVALARQFRSDGHVRNAGEGGGGSTTCAGQLWQRCGGQPQIRRACLQPGARHFPIHPALKT